MEIKEFVARRNALFNDGSDKAIQTMWSESGLSVPSDMSVIPAAFHKARLAWNGVSKADAAISVKWLLEHGYKTDMF